MTLGVDLLFASGAVPLLTCGSSFLQRLIAVLSSCPSSIMTLLVVPVPFTTCGGFPHITSLLCSSGVATFLSCGVDPFITYVSLVT